MAKEIKKFEVGKRYQMRSACDHDCVWTYKVESRTAGTVVLRQVKYDGTLNGDMARFRINAKISEIIGAEAVKPLGTFSMSPTLSADNIV